MVLLANITWLHKILKKKKKRTSMQQFAMYLCVSTACLHSLIKNFPQGKFKCFFLMAAITSSTLNVSVIMLRSSF